MKASVYISTSLDGFIARENGDLDWLPDDAGDSGGEDFGYKAFMASVDTLVMGRRTFQKALTFGDWPYGETPVVVLASDLSRMPPPPVRTMEYMSGAPAEIVARLHRRGAKHLYVDGGVTIQRFLAARLIQRLIITRIPVVLGSGIPLFGKINSDLKLNHVTTRQYPNGFVQSEYEVADTALIWADGR